MTEDVVLNAGYDIDDTKIDFIGPFVEFAGEKLGKKIPYSSFFDYDVGRALGVPREKAQELLDSFYAEYFHRLTPVDGALDALRYISRFSRAWDLTARPVEHRDVTIKSIDTHFVSQGIPIENIYFCFHHNAGHGNKRKHEHATELGLDFFVEDSPQNAVEIAGKGIPVFLLRRPWNTSVQPKENLTVCDNWQQVVELVDKLRKAKQGK
ncbi:MAG TPA: hypothetical protein VHA12_03270 [Candidatus Nanoarchaeia archaeon]|nr:hypothetical protein [Candidatus Nanoarchaeia archaeon]